MPRLTVPVLAVVAVVVLAFVIAGGADDDRYTVRLKLTNASGLRDGSPVVIAGLTAGRVRVKLSHDRRSILADITFDDAHRRVGRDVTAAIASQNLLGQKRLDIKPGTTRQPAPSGFVVPASQVSASADLDQVLDVLDASTRARLTILINEAGSAMAGRRQDFSELLKQLPPTFADVSELLNTLVGNNDVLARVVENSDSVISRFAEERKALSSMLANLAGTATTLAARRTDIRQTLTRAPETLATLRGALHGLDRATVPLGPAARDIVAAAPALSNTLARVEPFTADAKPTLSAASDVAPDLERLAREATPVLRRATPAVRSLARFGTSLEPVSKMLPLSAQNLLGVVSNWTHAIQFRDGLSHVFRGEVSFVPNALTGLLDRLNAASAPLAKRKSGTSSAPTPKAKTAPAASAGPSSGSNATPAAPVAPAPIKKAVDGVAKLLDDLLGKSAPAPPKGTTAPPANAADLLDGLLGK